MMGSDFDRVLNSGRRSHVAPWHCPVCDRDVVGKFLQLDGVIHCLECSHNWFEAKRQAITKRGAS